MKVTAVTQARYNSTRLPGKVLLEIDGASLLQIHLQRIHEAKKINGLIVATTHEKEADAIVAISEKLGVTVSRGSTDDVLERFYEAVKSEKPDLVVRLTSDCPLVDARVIDAVIAKCIDEGLDYCSNTLKPSFPDGCDVEVFTFASLEKAYLNATLVSEREHVTPYISKNSSFFGNPAFKSDNFFNEDDYSGYRLTVDELADFEVISELVKRGGTQLRWREYVTILQENAFLTQLNSKFKRNEGLLKSMKEDKIVLRSIEKFSMSNVYRNTIHDLIPGGAHTYSKGDDQFPELSPAAIRRGEGAHIWDIDGNKFLDCSMGLTSVSLGHAYKSVNDSIKAELDNGVNFQRPSYLEKEMAEKFLSVVPQHDMIKFAKNGSIVTTAAVKLARAYTGRKLVAFPGDHPFYSYDDWFIGKTACNKGVPEEIAALSVTFTSCSLESLQEMFDAHPGEIACVIMEPERSVNGNKKAFGEGAGEYLKAAIKLVHDNGALFIVDEMISGYKTAFPGSITKFGLDADMATWGKGIANGFSFCALTGKKEIMELGGITRKGEEKVFLISTTHGGETHSIAAGLATIREFQEKNVIKHNHSLGDELITKSTALISKMELDEYISVTPCNWMVSFAFRNENKEVSAEFRTLVMQEMIRHGVLFQGIFIPCFSHTTGDIAYILAALEKTFETYREALAGGYEKYLHGEAVKPVFRKIL